MNKPGAHTLDCCVLEAKLIIYDDFGLQPISNQVKLILLLILEDRWR